MRGFVGFYVRWVDWLSDWVGYIAMYLIFLMIATLLTDAVMRNFVQVPMHWGVEFAQFTLAAYYFMGGAKTLKDNSHVRMDLFYAELSPRKQNWLDLVTMVCLLFYLGVMAYGSWSSLAYAIATDERRFSMWNPSVIPIKILMLGCIVLMILQTFSLVFKHIAILRRQEPA